MPLPAPPRFSSREDIAAFAATPLEQRLAGRDIVTLIREAAEADPDAVAISSWPTGKADRPATPFTRRDIERGARAVAAVLAREGIKRSDIVASLLTNGPGTVAAAVGVLSAATLAPVNIFLEAAQVRALLVQSGAVAVLVPRAVPPALSGMFETLRALSADGTLKLIEIDTDRPMRPEGDVPALSPRALSERAALFHTGGTTGLPKFVPLSAGNLAAGCVISQFAYGYSEADNILCAMPMFHVGGLFACSLYPLAAGARVSVMGALGYRGDGVIANLPRTIADIEATVVVGPPTVMAQLANNPPDKTKTPRLRLFVNGAAALPRALGERLSAATGVPVVEPWGLTEATLAVTCGPRDGPRKQGSVGLALPYCGVKAARTDAAGRYAGDCDTDGVGVLAISGPMVFEGYLNRTADRQPFFEKGWLDTGDLGRVDSDGYIWVTGRAKELIKRGGHGIDPGIIEDALLAHEAVALAAAVGKPDAYAGEVPVAYVQLRPGASADTAALIDFARERIPERAAVPKEVFILDRLPLTAIGKVHKQTLKMDATRRAAESAAQQAAGNDTAIKVTAEPDPMHGIVVRARVPAIQAAAVQKALSVFAFHSETMPIEEDR